MASSSTKSTAAPAPNPSEQILTLSHGYMAAACLHIAADLSIAEQLANGPKPVAELAGGARGVNENALYRVLRALASSGIFTETEPRTFANTPASELLRPHVPGSLRNVVLWMANPTHLRVFGEMKHSVETGETTIKKVTGLEAFEYLKKNPAEEEVFNTAMTGFTAQFAPAVLEVYDFGGLGTIADIGGGHGLLLASMLKKHYGLRGIVFDAPHVVAGAQACIESMGLADRCEVAGGDFFQAVPAADSYILKSVIHDWNDASAVAILKNCADAMRRKDGKVILLETVVLPGNEPDFGKWLDLEMLVMAGGRERTEAEFAAMLAKAGLRLTRVVRTKSPMCVIESVKA